MGYAFDTSPLHEFWEILSKCVFGLQKEVYNFQDLGTDFNTPFHRYIKNKNSKNIDPHGSRLYPYLFVKCWLRIKICQPKLGNEV